VRAATSAAGRLRRRLPTLSGGAAVVSGPARAIAFWTAVALPTLELALLANGLSTPAQTSVFLSLLVVNLLALRVGHPYRRDS
jgi:hypothetical protein